MCVNVLVSNYKMSFNFVNEDVLECFVFFGENEWMNEKAKHLFFCVYGILCECLKCDFRGATISKP